MSRQNAFHRPLIFPQMRAPKLSRIIQNHLEIEGPRLDTLFRVILFASYLAWNYSFDYYPRFIAD